MTLLPEYIGTLIQQGVPISIYNQNSILIGSKFSSSVLLTYHQENWYTIDYVGENTRICTLYDIVLIFYNRALSLYQKGFIDIFIDDSSWYSLFTRCDLIRVDPVTYKWVPHDKSTGISYSIC